MVSHYDPLKVKHTEDIVSVLVVQTLIFVIFKNVDSSIRVRRVPQINSQAIKLQDLIDWTGEDIHEPVLTCQIPRNDLFKYIDEK